MRVFSRRYSLGTSDPLIPRGRRSEGEIDPSTAWGDPSECLLYAPNYWRVPPSEDEVNKSVYSLLLDYILSYRHSIVEKIVITIDP